MKLQEMLAQCIEQSLQSGGTPKTGKVQLLVEMNFSEGNLGTVAVDRYYDKFSFKGKEVHHEVTR
jgi:hypothetical protein